MVVILGVFFFFCADKEWRFWGKNSSVFSAAILTSHRSVNTGVINQNNYGPDPFTLASVSGIVHDGSLEQLGNCNGAIISLTICACVYFAMTCPNGFFEKVLLQ